MTVRRHESPIGSISQVTLEVPSRFTSSLQRALKLWTSRRGGSTSRFSPSQIAVGASGLTPWYREPGVQSDSTPAPKLYLRRISVLWIASQRRSGVVLMSISNTFSILLSSNLRLSPLRVAAQGSAYLLTQRSWTSRIGTAFRKCSFSRPRFFVTTRRASSSTRRCFITPKRVIGNRRSSALSVCPSSLNSASSSLRRGGAARARNTAFTHRIYVTVWSPVNWPFRTHARDASTAHPETSPVARLPLSRGQGAANGSAALLHRRAMASPHDLEQHRAALTGHCYRMMGSAADADDAVQETMVRAWRGLGGFEERASLRTWLTRIATRVCLDALADRTRRLRPIELEGPGTVDDPLTELPRGRWIEPIPDEVALPADADPLERVSLRQSIRLAFVAALQQLPPKQRAALLLTDVLGWPAAEVADTLDTSVARMRRSRCRPTSSGSEDTRTSAGGCSDGGSSAEAHGWCRPGLRARPRSASIGRPDPGRSSCSSCAAIASPP